jgi:HEAT repeat protein
MTLADEKGGAPVSVLVQILKSETDSDLKRMVIMTLGQTKSDEAVPVLLEAARDKDSRTATAAVMALGQIGTPKARAALMEIIEKKEPQQVKKDLSE